MLEGCGDVRPKLALSYNSRSGNGLLGVGWSLRGLSTIAPCDRTFAQDGFRDGVHSTAGTRCAWTAPGCCR
jgi:hypothetical protein